MKRLVLVPIIALAAVSPVLVAQNVTPPSPDTQTTSDNNPQPDDYEDPPKCESCGEEVEPTADSSGKKVCPEGSQEVKAAKSIHYTVGLGTTTYVSKNNFVSRDFGKRKPKFTGYNGPTTDAPPFSSSLSSEWGSKLVRPVTIGLVTDEITETSFTPAALELYAGKAGGAWVKKDASGALRQILSDQYLTDITVPATGGVLISSYLRSTIGALDPGSGLYSIPANARKFRTVLISRPTPTGLDIVDITTTDYSSSETMPKIRGARWVKSGSGTAADWTLSHHSGQPTAQNLISSDELIKEDLGGGLFQRSRTIRKPDSNGNPVIHSVTREKYRDLGNNTLRIVERVEAPGTPEELTTTYTYTDITGTGVVGLNGVITQPAAGNTTNLLTGARLHTMQRSDGYWEEYKYQYNGGTKIMLTEKWSVWKNSAIGDKEHSRHTTITLEENSRTVIEKIAGQIVSNVYEKLTLAADGTRTLREEKKTGANTAPLITEHAYFPDTAAEPNKGRIQYTRHPDGTLTRYTYSSVADPVTSGQTALKTTVETGAVDAAQFAPAATGPVPALTMGTRTETITNAFEKVIDAKSWDIASGLLLEQAVVTTVDAIGRPTHIIHDGDPDDYESFTFACCGVKTHRARDGTLTDYTKDALDRPTLTLVTLGPKTTTTGYTYTTETLGGRTLPKITITQTISAGSNTTGSLLVSESIKNLRGQILLTRSPDANGDSIPEKTTYIYDLATRMDSTTSPNGITRTNTHYADRQTQTSLSTHNGTPISVLTTYDYAPHNLNGGGIKTTVTTSGASIPAFAQSSYSNLVDRIFRTESPGYNGSSVITQTSFDERGRPVGRFSSGKPATRRVINHLGETTESWVDANGDGQFNDTAVNAIKDSVTKSISDYITEDQFICRRTRQWTRDGNNNDQLISTTFRSGDGTYQKSVPLAGTGPVTVALSAKHQSGNDSQTITTAIGSGYLTQVSTTTLNADGSTTSITVNKDTAGVTIRDASKTLDLQGRVISVSDGRKPATTYSDFTSTGTPLKTRRGDGTFTIVTLDAAARPTKVELYDSQNSLISAVHTTYHASGNVAAIWGTNINPTYRIHDLQGRLIELRTYRSANLALAPDTNTPDYDATIWTYEAATDLLLNKRYADGKGPDYTYTADGKLHTRTWARHEDAPIFTTYNYTASGKLATIDYSDSTPDVVITYDRLGRQASQSNDRAVSTFTYDPATLALDYETISYNLDGQPGFEFTRVLDRRAASYGRDTGWELKDGTTVENQAAYTFSPSDGRLQRISGLASPAQSFVAPEFTYSYVPSSNLIDAVTGPVHTVDNIWEDDRDVLDFKENKVGTTTVSKYDYGVNKLGQRMTVSQTGTAFAAARSITWGYDALGQVTSADSTESTHDRGYLYDAIGNRRGVRNEAVGVPTNSDGSIMANQGTIAYESNSLNQYTIANSISLPQDAYDSDGNLRNGRLPASQTENSELTWDAENRLVEVRVGTSGPLVRYAYDSQSRRIAKTVGTDTTLYLYDGWNVIAEYGSAGVTKTYSWGVDLSGTMQGAGGIGGLLAIRSGSQIHYPTFDGNGNVSEYLNSAGTPAAHFEYDPFGNTVVNTDATGEFSYRFSTKPLDALSGLYHYGYRLYSPQSGRWLSRDPLEEAGANPYLFVFNNGIDSIDVLGLIDYDRPTRNCTSGSFPLGLGADINKLSKGITKALKTIPKLGLWGEVEAEVEITKEFLDCEECCGSERWEKFSKETLTGSVKIAGTLGAGGNADAIIISGWIGGKVVVKGGAEIEHEIKLGGCDDTSDKCHSFSAELSWSAGFSLGGEVWSFGATIGRLTLDGTIGQRRTLNFECCPGSGCQYKGIGGTEGLSGSLSLTGCLGGACVTRYFFQSNPEI